MNPVNIRKVIKSAIVPQYATAGSACFDLHCINFGKLSADERSVIFDTGLEFEIPKGYVMLIFSRSGHGFKNDIRLANCVGVIDSDYRGEVKVKLSLDSLDEFQVEAFGRIAQAGIFPVEQVSFNVVEELSSTERGKNGFGSTGSGRKYIGQPL